MNVNIEMTEIDGALVVAPDLFQDARGFFQEAFRTDEFSKKSLPTQFYQLNHSGSVKDTVRGLHFQWEPPMGKLMRVIRGTAFLVAVDLRKDSPTLGKHITKVLSADDRKWLWAPASFARGFAVLSDFAEIEYLTTGIYSSIGESGIRWNDPAIGVKWPVSDPILSAKDTTAQTLAEWLARPESENFKL